MTTPHIPASVLAMFEEAGWKADRSVPNDVPTTHPAHKALRAFSGLRVGSTGAGESCARSDIDFRLLEVEPDDDAIQDWEELLKTTLVGVAEIHNAHGELWVASDGRCFGRSLIHDAFYFGGDTFGEAAERLLLGTKSRPLIHPKQDSVTLYGETYTPDHPDVYVYRSDSL